MLKGAFDTIDSKLYINNNYFDSINTNYDITYIELLILLRRKNKIYILLIILVVSLS